jgi:hypothetical protein
MEHKNMDDLTPLIPGFYVDRERRVRLNMREFMTLHGIPDSPEGRTVVWDEVKEIFGDAEVLEISDWDLLHRFRIVKTL